MLPTPACAPTFWYPEDELDFHPIALIGNVGSALRADGAQPRCGLLALWLGYLLYCHMDSISFCDELFS